MENSFIVHRPFTHLLHIIGDGRLRATIDITFLPFIYEKRNFPSRLNDLQKNNIFSDTTS
jgi:hypothetical protein